MTGTCRSLIAAAVLLGVFTATPARAQLRPALQGPLVAGQVKVVAQVHTAGAVELQIKRSADGRYETLMTAPVTDATSGVATFMLKDFDEDAFAARCWATSVIAALPRDKPTLSATVLAALTELNEDQRSQLRDGSWDSALIDAIKKAGLSARVLGALGDLRDKPASKKAFEDACWWPADGGQLRKGLKFGYVVRVSIKGAAGTGGVSDELLVQAAPKAKLVMRPPRGGAISWYAARCRAKRIMCA